MSLPATLRALVGDRTLRPIDVELALRLGQLGGRERGDANFDDESCLAALLASRAIDAGHSCIPIDAIADELAAVPWPEGGKPRAPDAAALARIEALGLLGRHSDASARPLVVEHERLYLQRYAALEQECAERLSRLSLETPAPITTDRLRPGTERYLFGRTDEKLAGATNWQAVACAVALRHRFSVLSGGPGTGKTWTLAMIALLLLEEARASDGPFRIALAAPTGKAAQRLRESLEQRLEEFRSAFDVREDDLDYLAQSGQTLHRLLGYRPGRVEFRHDADNPLEAECIVVDECSMVDLPLFTRLLRALKPGARLILVGDRQQLFPVEAGSVFAELFALCGRNRFDGSTADALRGACGLEVPREDRPEKHPLAGHVTCLEHSFRAEARVATVSQLIQRSEEEPTADALLRELVPGDAGARLQPASARSVVGLVTARVQGAARWFHALREAQDPAEALAALGRFRILCALRRGPLGVAGFNAAVEAALFPNPTLLPRHYHLRPILITQNDYRLRLYNGDIGVIFEGSDGRARACFPSTDGDADARRFAPSQLPPHETCYAMTIHKSQGSEFDEVLVVLPEEGSEGEHRLLARELIYTGVTRARKAVEIWGQPEMLAAAVTRGNRRYSGLPERLRASRSVDGD